MDKNYQPATIEQKWYQQWWQQGYFQANGQGAPYAIVIPPPNVTGTLHMGHGFQYTLMDILTRYQRMSGCHTLWQVGFDHAGIATQMVVERQLNAEGKTRYQLGREAFTQRLWRWTEQSSGTISQQMQRMGASVDWQRQRFMLDAGLSRAVVTAFERLYDAGLIYRGERLVNWDPQLKTALSDLEVISEEQEGQLWHIRYPVVDRDAVVVVATTRPETLFGDMAVAVHPDDPRYQALIGQSLQLPLTERTVTIIADEYVDPAFGSGCVKITPAHDFNDYEVGQRHQLPLLTILTPDAHLNDHVPQAYQGLDRFAAREKVIADLTAQGLLEKIEHHKHQVPYGDRSQVVLEPMLLPQWYVKTRPLADNAIAALKAKQFHFIPENWGKTYLQWLENIEDWCISRQLWWGHQIPVWYDPQGNTYVAADEAAVRKKYQLPANLALHQEDDVLDTWFSAALWPFASLGWPDVSLETFTRFYPTQVLVTGFDIIFFWVCRMVMFGLYFTGHVPFKAVYITGLIRDAQGQKMSKSKGNVLDPLDLMDGIALQSLLDKRTQGLMQTHNREAIRQATQQQFPQGINAYGCDALRFTFCALANSGRNIRFDTARLAGYRNFCNKLWNASRFVLMHCQDQVDHNNDAPQGLAEQWIHSRLQRTIATVHQQIKAYRFDLLSQCLHEFTWNDYCDWYVELAKIALTHPEHACGVRYTLATVLETLLRLLHPIIPFITEEIWQAVKPLTTVTTASLMCCPFPTVDDTLLNPMAEAEMQCVQHVIVAIRTLRAERTLAPNKWITIYCKQANLDQRRCLQQQQAIIKTLAKVETFELLTADQPSPNDSACLLVANMEIILPLTGLIDVAAEVERLTKAVVKVEKTINQAQGKLNNPNYITKAPEAVVAKEQQRLSEAKASRAQLTENIRMLTDKAP